MSTKSRESRVGLCADSGMVANKALTNGRVLNKLVLLEGVVEELHSGRRE